MLEFIVAADYDTAIINTSTWSANSHPLAQLFAGLFAHGSTTRCKHGRRRVGSLIFSQNCRYPPSLLLLTFVSSISLPPRTARCETHERTSRNVGQSEKRVINRWRSRTSFLDRKLLSTANSALSRVTLNYANSQSGKYNRSPDDELLRAVCCRRDDHSYFISPYFFFPRDSRSVSQVDNKYGRTSLAEFQDLQSRRHRSCQVMRSCRSRATK